MHLNKENSLIWLSKVGTIQQKSNVFKCTKANDLLPVMYVQLKAACELEKLHR